MALFEALTRLAGDDLELARLIQNAGAFVFCAAPGSVLGIRTGAMAIRTWVALRGRPVYAYHALELAAAAHGRADTAFIADARRGEWHWCQPGRAPERVREADLVPRAQAENVSLATLEGFRAWAPLPPGTRQARYDIGEAWKIAAEQPLLSPCPEPDALLAAEPTYLRWTPQLHRAAGPP